jgi:predicted RND superfamily exporter protein
MKFDLYKTKIELIKPYDSIVLTAIMGLIGFVTVDTATADELRDVGIIALIAIIPLFITFLILIKKLKCIKKKMEEEL